MPKAPKFNVSRRSANFVDPVTIGFDRLQILIQTFSKQVEDRLFWLTPLAVAVTLFTTLVVSDFKDKFGVRADVWRVIVVISLVAFSAWTLIALVRAIKRQSLMDLMDGIAAESLSPLRNYALAFFRAKDRNGTNYVLVYFDQIWGCYLCPYVSLQPDQSDPSDVSEPTADRFGLPKHALLALEADGLEVRQAKISKASHKLNNYRFVFYVMKVQRGYTDTFTKREFEIQDRRYKWMTIEELLSDPVSMQQNGEVFCYIRDTRHRFFSDDMPLAIDLVIHE